jgi:L-histidine N-alpha-methyltransferase
MHTENSCKWQLDDFAALLQQAGFSRLRHWTDENGWFAVFLGFA